MVPEPATKPDSIPELITNASTFCTTLLSQLSAKPAATSDGPAPVPIATVRNDLVTLLTLLGKESTSLSLAFKPPTSIAAVEGTVATIHGLLNKLAYCIQVCPKGGALAKEINWTAQEAVEAVQRLLDGSLQGHQATTPKRAKDLREVNLRFTAQVWEKVECAANLSTDELQATRREWKSVLGLLDDCLEEVKEMEDSPSAEEAEDGDEGDSDSDSDDYRTSHPLSPLERSRVTAAHMLLRLSRLLLQRLITSTAPALAPAGYSSPSFLTASQALVQSLSATADDFAANLEPPQADVGAMCARLEEVGRELSDEIGKAVVGAGAGKPEETEGTAKEVESAEAEGKWQVMWREQMGKAKGKLESLGP